MKRIVVNLTLLVGAFSIPTVQNKENLPEHDPILYGEEVTLENHHYGPKYIQCPPNNEAEVIEPQISLTDELDFIEKRRPKNKEALLKFFKRTIGKVKDSQLDLEKFIENKNLTIGLSFSGGGYKSLFLGAGQLSGLDDRVENKSPLSGILQASSYIASNNEGNWLLGPLIAHGFPVVSQLFNSPDMFNFNNDLINPYGSETEKNEQYWEKITETLINKYNAGFPVSPADILGRALSFQLLGEKKDSKWDSFTLSNVADLEAFQNAEMPYPLLTAQLTRYSADKGYKNTLPLEMSPHIINVWDKNYDISLKTKYFGSYDGNNYRVCVENFDNLGFLIAMSTGFDTSFIEDLYEPIAKYAQNNAALSNFKRSMFGLPQENDKKPGYHLIHRKDPFVVNRPDTFILRDLFTSLGYDTKDRVELNAFTNPNRNVDIVFIFDNTRDYYTPLPTLGAVDNTINYLTAKNLPNPIPSLGKWFNRHSRVPAKPGFLGCDATDNPLFIYVPNGYYVKDIKIPLENQTIFTDEEVASLIDNGLASVSLSNNETNNSDWGTCVACAMVNHKLKKDKDDFKLPETCLKCLEKYCINKTPEYNFYVARR